MVSLRRFPGPASSRRPLMVSLVQLSFWWYQPRGVSRAQPRRVARRRSGSLMLGGVWGGCSGSGGVWRGGEVYVDVCVVLGGLGWAGRCQVVLWVRQGWSRGVTVACGGGVLW